MSLKAKIDVFPFERYLLQDPTVMSVMQAVVRSGGNTGSMNDPSGVGGGGGGANKRRDSGGNATHVVERRRKTPFEKLMSLKVRCREEQCVHSVEGVLLVHVHDHPHVLLLRGSNTAGQARARVLPPTNANHTGVYYLPGGRCRKGEAEEAGLLRKLGRDLLHEQKTPGVARAADGGHADTVVDVGVSHSAGLVSSSAAFRVGEALSRWYRPHFEPFMYPYVPPHVAENDVKEVRTIFLVHLPPQLLLTVAQPDMELVAAPLFDLYENAAKYGSLIASIPTLLSRVNINYCK